MKSAAGQIVSISHWPKNRNQQRFCSQEGLESYHQHSGSSFQLQPSEVSKFDASIEVDCANEEAIRGKSQTIRQKVNSMQLELYVQKIKE